MTTAQIYSYFARQSGLKFGSKYFRGLREVQLGKNPLQALRDADEQQNFAIDDNLEEYQRDLELFKAMKIRVVCPIDKHFPQALLSTPEPPVFLSFWGQPVWNHIPMLSIVGTREPTRDAAIWMENTLTAFLRSTESVIVSGAARGIDLQAHNMALRCSRPTIALLPSGLGSVYPTSFQPMIKEIIRTGGAVVSEYSPNARMQKVYFHERNRLISGLSPVVLLVQARIRSGSMITAYHALRQGRTVAVVPWSPMDPMSEGTNQLLHDGASIVRDHNDLEVLMSLSAHCRTDLIPDTSNGVNGGY